MMNSLLNNALPNDSEEWRDIPGYEGLYQVSSLGRVRSLPWARDNWREDFPSLEAA